MIRDDFISGNYPYNTKLASKCNLAEQVGVSTITVEHAYELFCDEGYAEARERSGFIVAFRNSDGIAASAVFPAKQASYQVDHIHLNFPLSVLSKTMRKVLSEHGELLLEKSPDCGCDALRTAIRRHPARNRILCH